MLSRLLTEMQNLGLIVDTVTVDKKLHRLPVFGKKGLPGWYVAKEVNGKLFATFGDWSTQQKYTFKNGQEDTCNLSPDDLRVMALLAEAERKERERRQRKAAEMSLKVWQAAGPVPADHPYLITKGIKSHQARFEAETGALLINLIDRNGNHVSIQRIKDKSQLSSPEEPSKRLFKYGRKKGCCHVIDGATDKIFICEGFATGATINELTGCKVLVAIDSGNLLQVAKITREKYPDWKNPKPIYIAADNDHKKRDNVGLTKAREAAEEIGAECIFPEGIEGTDFNDMAAEKGAEATRAVIEGDGREPERPLDVMGREDFEAETLTLYIPDDVLKPGGLFDKGIDGLNAPGMPRIDQYSWPVVAVCLARAIAGKITCQGVWPNIYCIKVGPTSSGKSVADHEMRKALNNAGLSDFYGMTDVASGAAIYRGLEQNPRTILVLDEATPIFRRYQKADPVSDSIRDALLDLYSSPGQAVRKPYGNSKLSINIENPCLIFTGNATPIIFDSITPDDFRTGTMQRVDFFCYDGPIPQRGVRQSSNPPLDAFVKGLAELYSANRGGNLGTPLGGTNITGAAVEIDLDQEATSILNDYSRDIITRSNELSEESGKRGIVSRGYDLAIKYALIHIGSTRAGSAIFEPMTGRDIEWGIKASEMITSWKVNVLSGRVTSGEFHRNCEIFKDAIKAVVQKGQRPTFKNMADRRKILKNWKRKDSEEIIAVLMKRGEIIVDESGTKTAYYLPKKVSE